MTFQEIFEVGIRDDAVCVYSAKNHTIYIEGIMPYWMAVGFQTILWVKKYMMLHEKKSYSDNFGGKH